MSVPKGFEDDPTEETFRLRVECIRLRLALDVSEAELASALLAMGHFRSRTKLAERLADADIEVENAESAFLSTKISNKGGFSKNLTRRDNARIEREHAFANYKQSKEQDNE